VSYLPTSTYPTVNDETEQQAFIVKVYGWMTAGLMITAIVAKLMASALEDGALKGLDPRIMIFLVLVQLGIALGMRWCLDKLPVMVIAAMFVTYAVITGVFFSVYFLLFTGESITTTFLTCSITFAGMSVYGMVTKRDLTNLGSLLIMAFWGLLIASLINLFVQSSGLYWATTYIGVLVFVGLTAYDTQKMKYLYLAGAAGSSTQQKVAMMAAFELYLDFVILFQYLIRILGKRR